MTKKMVVKVTMDCQKCRSKAMKIAVSLPGVESASLKGDDKSQIEVTGDAWVDPVKLTRLLRKRMGHAELVSVAAEKEKKEKVEPVLGYVCTPYQPYNVGYREPSYGYVQQFHEPSCSIL